VLIKPGKDLKIIGGKRVLDSIKTKVNQFLGRGTSSIFVPPMDGRLKANDILDKTEVLCEIEKVDNLTVFGEHIYASSHNKLVKIIENTPEIIETLDYEITALAFGSSGVLAIGLSNDTVLCYDVGRKSIILEVEFECVTALLFWDPETLVVASGSQQFSAPDWRSDLMNLGSTGSLWVFNVESRSKKYLVGDLKWPAGLCKLNDQLLFSEAWNHAVNLIEFAAAGDFEIKSNQEILSRLPAYPSRIVNTQDNCIWLCLFAPRNQLIEFVLTEKDYRAKMLSQVDERFWIAPSFRSGLDFREPLQGGGVKMMGVLKPWAPAFSYGLVVKLDRNFQPEKSLHSRADGKAHGITSAACLPEGQLFLSSRGDNKVIRYIEQ
jgi:hypothetical protein